MLRVVFITLLLVFLNACSSSGPKWKGVYSSEAEKIDSSSLDVPPDLSQPSVTQNLALPKIAVSGSTYSAYTNTESVV